MTELLNCPFCGWATGLSVFDGGDQPYWVECPDCCAQGSPEETKAEAIAAWNARASDAEITRLTESMRAAEERLLDATQALTDLRSKPYAPWPEPDPEDTVGAMIDNQAWIMMSHIASFIGHRDGQPDLMEQWQEDWAENYSHLLKDWFSPHRAAARYVADRLAARARTERPQP